MERKQYGSTTLIIIFLSQLSNLLSRRVNSHRNLTSKYISGHTNKNHKNNATGKYDRFQQKKTKQEKTFQKHEVLPEMMINQFCEKKDQKPCQKYRNPTILEKREVLWKAAVSKSCTQKELSKALDLIYYETGITPWQMYYDPKLGHIAIQNPKEKLSKYKTCSEAQAFAFDFDTNIVSKVVIIPEYAKDVLFDHLYAQYFQQLEKNQTKELCGFENNKVDMYQKNLRGIIDKSKFSGEEIFFNKWINISDACQIAIRKKYETDKKEGKFSFYPPVPPQNFDKDGHCKPTENLPKKIKQNYQSYCCTPYITTNLLLNMYEQNTDFQGVCNNEFTNNREDFQKNRITEQEIQNIDIKFWESISTILRAIYENINTPNCWFPLASKSSVKLKDNTFVSADIFKDISRLAFGTKLSFMSQFEGKFPGGVNLIQKQLEDLKTGKTYSLKLDCERDQYWSKNHIRLLLCNNMKKYYKAKNNCGNLTGKDQPLRKYLATALRSIKQKVIVDNKGDVKAPHDLKWNDKSYSTLSSKILQENIVKLISVIFVVYQLSI